ncbi:uncharacterized protein LOC141849470 [Brevipalpus obovatus]|uniref:uncharacterized protein LOC141849470 n=1 Tax=Brevipalpus obovatus TaxID=246614 RepID=UPI003D9DF3A9
MVVSRRYPRDRTSILRSRSLSSLYEQENVEDDKSGTHLLTGISTLRQSSGDKNLLGQWLEEISDDTISSEVPMCQLESKSVAIDPGSLDALLVRNAQIAITQIRALSASILDEIDDMIDLLPLTIVQLSSYHDSFIQISANIASLVELCYGEEGDFGNYCNARLQISLSTICHEMTEFISNFAKRKKINNAQLEATLRKLKERVGEMVGLTIKKGIEIITRGMTIARGPICLKWSLVALWQLTKSDHYVCRILVEEYDMVRKLIHLNRCQQHMTLNSTLRAPIFRILAHICLNTNALHLVYNYLNITTDILPHLIDRDSNLAREILTLLVQVTIPFIDFRRSHKHDNTLSHFIGSVPMDRFVRSITALALGNLSRDVFLMASTTLANISFLDANTIINNDCLRALLSTIGKSTQLGNDLSVREQMMALLANVSAVNPLEVVYCGGLAALIESVRIQPNPSVHSETELISLRRIRFQVETTIRRLMKNEYLAAFIQQISCPPQPQPPPPPSLTSPTATMATDSTTIGDNANTNSKSGTLKLRSKSHTLVNSRCNPDSVIKSWTSSGNLPASEETYSYRSYSTICQHNHPPIFHHESYV